ncbi:hypothetical protein O6H91_05G108200 [Diphasiastrum complanatum]|uniref:Uncharacterized protein n=1 Tax=Diphasiastrum complanatum TaxID=34168 RepID=A0ACC2DRT7_DIPCM|nr:hypothetical protein O6H91_05G108200 [Diphasiastrum complanatum]
MAHFAVDTQSRAQVSGLMDQAVKLGPNVGHTWAFNDGSYRALQISPGVFNEHVFQGSYLQSLASQQTRLGAAKCSKWT